MAKASRKQRRVTPTKPRTDLPASAWDLFEFRNLYKNAPLGLYSVDRSFRFIHVNEYLAKLNGIPADDHKGRTVREIVPTIADGLEELFRRVLDTGKPVVDLKMQWSAPVTPERITDKISNYYPIQDESGAVVGISAIVFDVTAQMTVERALREREQRYTLFFQKANDGLFMFRVSREGVPGKFLDANETACRMLGYSREELLEMSPADFRGPEVGPDPNHFLRQALHTGHAVFEREIRSKMGARMPVEISATPFDLGGQPALFTIIRDISERKRAEAELRKSTDLNEQVLASVQEGIVVADRESRLVAWNPFMEALSRVKKQEALGRNAFELFPFLGGLGVEALANRALAGEYISGLDFPFQNIATGRSGWVSVSTGPLRDSNGHIVGTLSTLRDITQAKQMEAALWESSEFNRQVIETTSEGIVVLDRDLKTLLWNPFMEGVSGVPAGRMRGTNPFSLFPFLRKENLDELCQRALRGESCAAPDFEYSVPQTAKSGWAAVRVSPLRNSEQQIIGVLANIREISESKQREEELRRLSSRLLQLQDDERRRIARDLHDTFSQRVLAASLNLALLEQSAKSLDERARAALSETREIIDNFGKEIRSLSYLLHPPVLDELGLASALEEFAAGFGERSGIQVELEIAPRIGRLLQEAETALFRIVQESLANVQRHSGSATAQIRLYKEDSRLVLEIADQGQWKSRRRMVEGRIGAERLGVGIPGMRERIRQLGGALEVESSATGTTVRAVLPQIEKVRYANANTDRG
jgi:PAS domain S-box-containing protein